RITGITVNARGGTNIIYVLNTVASAPVTISGSGTDYLFIGKTGSVQGIHGTVSVLNRSSATALRVDDSSDPVSRSLILSDRAVTGLAPAVINYAGGVKSLVVQGSKGGTKFSVLGVRGGMTTTLEGHADNDTFTVGDA